MSQYNTNLTNHIIIYLILYSVDNNTNNNIYKIGKTNKKDFSIRLPSKCILLYQRVIENRGDTCNAILYEMKSIFKMRNDVSNNCFEGDFNNMIKLINHTIDDIFNKLPNMSTNFNISNNNKNIPIVTPKHILRRNTNTDIDDIETKQLTIRSIEQNSKESMKNINKYISCLSNQRILNEYIRIGNCLHNIDNDLFELWSNLTPLIENNNPLIISPRWDLHIKWSKMSKNKYNIADLKLWSMLDNMDKLFNIIEHDIMRAVNTIGTNITPYNMTMISHRHFKHFHIYTNNKWYYYDVQSLKWEIDIENLNINQSLIRNIILIFEKYTNYENIIQMYNDDLFMNEILTIASQLFFNKNNFSSEYLKNTMIDYNNLP
jgi:hypothetical protein